MQHGLAVPKKLARLYLVQRTGLALLGLWLLTLLVVASYTIKLLWDEDQIHAKAVEQAQANALTTLKEHVEQTLGTALLYPMGSLKNLSSNELDTNNIKMLQAKFPYLRLVLLLDQQRNILQTFPPGKMDKLANMLASRIQMERLTTNISAFGMHVFIEPLTDITMILALGSISDVGATSGWLLLGFDLTNLLKQKIQPLLDTFGQRESGQALLIQPDETWNKTAIHMPISHILPGYFLTFQSDPINKAHITTHKALPIILSILVLLAMGLASWSAFREVFRSNAVADLRQRFVANVSHELKTPLALIRMYAETLHLGRISDPERIATYHQVILREAERLSSMIQNVLAFASLNHSEKKYYLQPGDLAKAVAEIIEDVRPNIEARGFLLHSDLATDLPPLPYEREGIARILWNLLDNAAKYAGTGKIDVLLYRATTMVILDVVDHGPGVPEAERQRILRPFERGLETDDINGSGLGLALVTQVVEVHNATFSLEEGPDGGLCARVAFPIVELK
jgi:signal transduction histidine kinase